jgi:hypothetical protein
MLCCQPCCRSSGAPGGALPGDCVSNPQDLDRGLVVPNEAWGLCNGGGDGSGAGQFTIYRGRCAPSAPVVLLCCLVFAAARRVCTVHPCRSLSGAAAVDAVLLL